jgi:hypothetical protein
MLRDEDGKIYDNIQFNPNIILNIDRPLVQYMSYVNQLEASQWSAQVANIQNDFDCSNSLPKLGIMNK